MTELTAQDRDGNVGHRGRRVTGVCDAVSQDGLQFDCFGHRYSPVACWMSLA